MIQDVLIVDDSATIRQMVKRTMEMAGLNEGALYEAAEGIEALAQLNDYPVAAELRATQHQCAPNDVSHVAMQALRSPDLFRPAVATP
jgi:CheY-like chemotaxis protein